MVVGARPIVMGYFVALRRFRGQESLCDQYMCEFADCSAPRSRSGPFASGKFINDIAASVLSRLLKATRLY